MFEIIKYNNEKNTLILKYKIQETKCTLCKSTELKNNNKYYKIIDPSKMDFKIETKIILMNIQKQCKNCNKTFFKYKIKDIDFSSQKCFKSLVLILLERNLIKFEDINQEEKEALLGIKENPSDSFVIYRKPTKTNQKDIKNKVKIINIKTLETRYLVEKTEKVKKYKLI